MTQAIGEPGGEPRVYAVRVSERAARKIEAEQDRLQQAAGGAASEAWAEGIADMIAGLRTYPERCAVAREDDLFEGGTRRTQLYQRRPGGPTWRILFSVHDAGEEGPTVRVQMVLDGAQAPLTEWPDEEEGA